MAAAVVLNSLADRDSSGQVVTRGEVSAHELATGDCIEEIPQTEEVLTVPVVPCTDAHVAEVYATFDLADDDWPGSDEVLERSDSGCLDQLHAFPDAYDDPEIEVLYLHPSEATWRTGDREVLCVAHYLDGPRTDTLG